MTEELNKHQQELKSKIHEAVEDFNKKSGLKVSSLDFVYEQMAFTNENVLIQTFVNVEL